MAGIKVAAQLTAKMLGGGGEKYRDIFEDPQKMLQLILAAESTRGGPAVEAVAADRDLDRAVLAAGPGGPAAAVARVGAAARTAAEACGRRGKPPVAEAVRVAA